VHCAAPSGQLTQVATHDLQRPARNGSNCTSFFYVRGILHGQEEKDLFARRFASASCHKKSPTRSLLTSLFIKSIIMAPSVSDNQCEVVLVGCGAPLRGMGWCVRKKDECMLYTKTPATALVSWVHVHRPPFMTHTCFVSLVRYHAVQLLGGECPSAVLCYVVEPWFMGTSLLRVASDPACHLRILPWITQ
jgi:hypothetical protein